MCLTFYMPPLVLQHGKSFLPHSFPLIRKTKIHPPTLRRKLQTISHLPVLGSTSAGKCGGGFPGVKCSLLYVISGVRGCTWCGCCTTGTLLDCQDKKVDGVRGVPGTPHCSTRHDIEKFEDFNIVLRLFQIPSWCPVFPPSCLKPPHTPSLLLTSFNLFDPSCSCTEQQQFFKIFPFYFIILRFTSKMQADSSVRG